MQNTLTASRLHTVGMPLDMMRDILGQVDEKTTLGYMRLHHVTSPKTGTLATEHHSL